MPTSGYPHMRLRYLLQDMTISAYDDGMVQHVTPVAPSRTQRALGGKLSTIDRYLPVWIFAAMGLGLGLGRAWPGIGPGLDRVKLDTVSLPIAVGLLWMM